VTPTLATRYQVELFRDSTATTPSAALNTEISKQVYPYFAVNLAPSAIPATPALMQLGAGDPGVTAPQRISADEYQQSVTFTFQAGNDAWHASFNVCTRDTEAEDGFGLPGHHSCGDPQVPSSSTYLG
jgi:hypothetical protein